MREPDWASLVQSVETGNCTLMLGPDAVTGRLHGQSLPVHVALATFIKDRLGNQAAHLDPAKPSSVAQAAVAQEDQNALQVWVNEFYDEFDVDVAVLHHFAELPFELVVSTSPGYSVHRLFSEVKPDTHPAYYDRTAPARPMLPNPSADAPVVYNLFGSLERPSSLILSDSDRLDFIVSVASDEPPLPTNLKSMLCDDRRSCLFLGFDLADWQFRVLLHILSPDRPRQTKSFAFELDSDAVDAATAEFYRSGHRIHFVNAKIPEFAAELRARVRTPDTPSDPTEQDEVDVPPGAPTAFICHANDDKPTAQWVADGLRASGIEAWFDREQLSGGDRWEEKIPHVINEQVDYVIVLQSANLKSREVGFVNREINLALERDTYYRKPRKFVIPVVIDSPENRLDELKHLQSTDLSQASELNELVRAIKFDVDLKARAR